MTTESIELNVEQWRRDVKTFVRTTLSELDEITDQLSSGVAAPGSTRSILPSEPTTSPLDTGFADSLKPANGIGKAENRDQRLAALKHKLSKLK